MEEHNSNRKVQIQILGQEYNVTGGSSEYLQELAQFVNKQLLDLSNGEKKYSPGKLGILGCLNIANQLFKLRIKHNNLTEKTLNVVEKVIEKIDKNAKDIPESLDSKIPIEEPELFSLEQEAFEQLTV